MQYFYVLALAMVFLGCSGGSSSEEQEKQVIENDYGACEVTLEYKDDSSGLSLCVDDYTQEECQDASGEDDELIATAKLNASTCSSLGYVDSLLQDGEKWYYKLESEDSVLPDTNFNSLSEPRVVGITTDMGDGSVLSTLTPLFRSALSLINLRDQSFTLSVTTSSGEKEISYTLFNERELEFTAPADLIDGFITITSDGATIQYPYSVRSLSVARLISADKESAQPSQRVTLYGKNLSTSAMTLVFENQDTSLQQTLSPSAESVSFLVPQNAKSGYIYLERGDLQTNRLYLQVAKEIELQVRLANGVSLDPSEISFVRGADEYVLDSSYKTSMGVESKLLDYVHATVLHEDEGAILYSSVILPDTTTKVDVDPTSTAIAWIFMGLSAEVTSTSEDLQALYNSVASNTKVQEFASYIASLQANNLEAWLKLSDATLKTKYQDALGSVVQEYSTRSVSSRSLQRAGNEIIITQDPLNNNIYVDDKSYDYLTYGQKLNNGGVSIVNDTKLYLSVEILDAKEKSIVNGYEHVDELMSMNHKSLIGPKGWGLLGIASSKTLELQGKDSTIEIVVGSARGVTDQGALSVALQSRVFIDGVATPMLNMVLSTLINKRITEGHRLYSYKNIIDAMSDIYGASFFTELTTMVSDKDNGYYAIADTLILKPLTRGFNACFQVPVGGACDKTIDGVAKLIGLNSENAVNKIMLMVAQTAGKRVLKRSVAVVPVAGWISSAAFFVYDNIGTISDSATIAESLIDMGLNPKEINVAVDFPLELQSVSPTCVGITPQSTSQIFTLKGEGFAPEGGVAPQISISSASKNVLMHSASVAAGGEEMSATFNAQTLLGSGSWLGTLGIEHLGQKISYATPLRLISSEDSAIYLDTITPEEALRGEVITLEGCGWIPLESLEVEFQTANGRKTVQTSFKSLDTIEVEVPLDAISGLVYVKTTNKYTSQWLEIKEFSLSGTSKDELVDGTQFALQGGGLSEAAHIYLRDSQGNILEGQMSNITNTGIWVTAPNGLEFGEVAVYVVLEDGVKSNELSLKKVPLSPEASPSYGIIENGLSITLRQEEGVQIYYMLADNTTANERLYTAPITLRVEDMKYTQQFLYTFARVEVDGVEYDSSTASYTYDPCPEGEELDAYRECVEIGANTDEPLTFPEDGDYRANLVVTSGDANCGGGSMSLYVENGAFSSIYFPNGSFSSSGLCPIETLDVLSMDSGVANINGTCSSEMLSYKSTLMFSGKIQTNTQGDQEFIDGTWSREFNDAFGLSSCSGIIEKWSW